MLDAWIIDHLKREQETEDHRIPLYAPRPSDAVDVPDTSPSPKEKKENLFDVDFSL